MIDMFKKKFFLFVLLGSVLGVVIGGIYSIYLDHKLTNAEIKYCYDFRTYEFYPSVIVLDNYKDKDKYISLFTGGDLDANFSMTVLEEGAKVYVLESSPDSLLLKIGHNQVGFSKTRGGYNEFWIWHEFLQDSPQQIDK